MGKKFKMSMKKKQKMGRKGESNVAGFKRVPKKPDQHYGKFLSRLSLDIPDWDEMDLEEVKKDFYQEHPLVTGRDEAAIAEYRSQNKITVNGCDCPKPIQAFDECNFSESIMSAIKEQNIVMPTPIQSQALPVALSGRDMVGIAETGSGKTLAYILPAITHIHGKEQSRGLGEPDVIVLAPTRELAQQIHQVVLSLGPEIKVTSECFYGGAKRKDQKSCAEKVFEICIATPGRFIDFLYEKLVKLNRCTYFVLDEADRMLDMGFEPQIKAIISQARPDRQMLMFSATWPPEIKCLAESYLKNYVLMNIGALQISANHNISQRIEICEQSDKPQRIAKIMKYVLEQEENKTLIFVNSKLDVDILTLKFRLNGWEALGLHGSKKQAERDQVFGDFKTGKTPVLIATDLAARGLDVDDIKFIVNYDYPKSSEDYVHRIGRTGRCNRTGTAITLFTPDDRSGAGDLISVLEEADQYVSPQLQNLEFLPPLPECLMPDPPIHKLKKRELKRLVTRSEINRVPLGTATNTESLPDLDDLIDPFALKDAVFGMKNKKSKKKVFALITKAAKKSRLMNSHQAHRVNKFKWTKNYANSQMSRIGMATGNRNVGMNMNPGNMGMPMNPGNMGMPMNPGNMGMPMNPGNTRMPMNPGNTRMPMNPGNMRMPMNPGNMRMPMNPGNMRMPMNPGNMRMPMNPGNMGMPMNARNPGNYWNERNVGMSVDVRGNNSSAGWPGWGNSTYGNYISQQNSNWGGYRNNYCPNRAQNSWSASGSYQSPGRYGPYGYQEM